MSFTDGYEVTTWTGRGNSHDILKSLSWWVMTINFRIRVSSYWQILVIIGEGNFPFKRSTKSDALILIVVSPIKFIYPHKTTNWTNCKENMIGCQADGSEDSGRVLKSLMQAICSRFKFIREYISRMPGENQPHMIIRQSTSFRIRSITCLSNHLKLLEIRW